jgi:glyoxylase-like metal-dependent hydrolase (beta-lactamase superfamily II)
VSEPRTVATSLEEVVPGVRRWSIHDERINFVSAAYAVTGDDKTVLIDPLPLERAALGELGNVTAIVLTCGSHQRSAWRYRRELEAPVYAPGLAKEIDEEPDVRYGDGDRLPGSLVAVFTPGVGTTQHTLLLAGEPTIAFIADTLLEYPDGKVGLVPERYIYDFAEARRTLAKMLELDFDVACLGHGGVLSEDPKAAIRTVLEQASASKATGPL